MLEQAPGRTHDPAGKACWNSLVLKDCTLWKGSMLEQFTKNCNLWEGLAVTRFVENCLCDRDPMLEQENESFHWGSSNKVS